MEYDKEIGGVCLPVKAVRIQKSLNEKFQKIGDDSRKKWQSHSYPQYKKWCATNLELGKGERVEKDEENNVDDEGYAPGGEHGDGNVLDNAGGGETAQVYGGEPRAADNAAHHLSRTQRIAGNVHLHPGEEGVLSLTAGRKIKVKMQQCCK